MREFNETAEIGLPIFWYPHGVMSDTPCIGFIRVGRSQGKADIVILPDIDGSCVMKDSVAHAGSRDAKDHMGRLHPNALRVGLWDYSPWSWEYLDRKAVKPATEERKIRREMPQKQEALV